MIQDKAQLAVAREQAERLEMALADIRACAVQSNPSKVRLMTEPLAEDLSLIRAEIDQFIGIAAFNESNAALVLSLEGDNVRYGDTRGSVVTKAIDGLRRGVQNILGAMVGVDDLSTTGGGRRARWIEELSDFPVASLASGSVRVVLGEPNTTAPFEALQHESLHRAVRLLGQAAAVANSAEALAALLTNEPPQVSEAVLAALRGLAPPRNSDVETVTISGRFMPPAIVGRLTRRSRAEIGQAVKKLMKASNEPGDQAEGDLRELDLDKREFTVRQVGEDKVEVLCDFDEEMLADVMELFGTRVFVSGKRLGSGLRRKIHVYAIGPAEESGERLPFGQ